MVRARGAPVGAVHRARRHFEQTGDAFGVALGEGGVGAGTFFFFFFLVSILLCCFVFRFRSAALPSELMFSIFLLERGGGGTVGEGGGGEAPKRRQSRERVIVRRGGRHKFLGKCLDVQDYTRYFYTND